MVSGEDGTGGGVGHLPLVLEHGDQSDIILQAEVEKHPGGTDAPEKSIGG
jgi:hypothetical protein